jgi:hypothetical protein
VYFNLKRIISSKSESSAVVKRIFEKVGVVRDGVPTDQMWRMLNIGLALGAVYPHRVQFFSFRFFSHSIPFYLEVSSYIYSHSHSSTTATKTFAGVSNNRSNTPDTTAWPLVLVFA